MRASWLKLIIIIAYYLATAGPLTANDTWRTRAVVTVATPGVIEAVVPPELINQTDGRPMDFSLTGPEGRSRAFTLYWREAVGKTRFELSPAKVRLDPAKGLIWEAPLPANVVARRLHINLAETGIVGQIDVYGRQNNTWSILIKNAAIFKTAGVRQATIDIPLNTCDGLQLHLTGYDRRTRQTLVPIQSVEIEADRQGKDYVEQTVKMPFHQSESQGGTIIETVLPGDGLWISALHLTTQFQFQGDWQVGREQIIGGTRRFETIAKGRQAQINPTPLNFETAINQTWSGRSLVLKLDAGNFSIGQVATLAATVRLPRIIFSAEQTGEYTALAGTGQSTPVLDQINAKQNQPRTLLSFATPENNPQWRLASLVEKYRLMGGPFDPEGYTWRTLISISAPGYYRLPLNLEASLAPRRSAVRIVREKTQVPYITGRPEDRSIDLEFSPVYDAPKNTTTWNVTLPQASSHWTTLTLYAKGLFQRTIELHQPKQGKRNWQLWQQVVWENRSEHESTLKLDLRRLPDNVSALRLVVPHGDNQPIAISRIKASYSAPTVYFLAHTPGEYAIYGGNAQAGAPQYDLSLVQSELLSTLPTEVHMGSLDTFRQPSWQDRINIAFKESGWGLYMVLGGVTLVLLIVIVKLFPKPADQGKD